MKKLVIAFGVVFVFTCGLLIGKTFINVNNDHVLTEEEICAHYIESHYDDYNDHEYTLDIYEVDYNNDTVWAHGFVYKDGNLDAGVGFNYSYYAEQAANARNS